MTDKVERGSMEMWLIDGDNIAASFFYDATNSRCIQAAPGFEMLVGLDIATITKYLNMRGLGLHQVPGLRVG